MINDALAQWFITQESMTFTLFVCEGVKPSIAQLTSLSAAYSGAALVNAYCAASGARRLKTYSFAGTASDVVAGKSKCSLVPTGNVFHSDGTAQFFVMQSSKDIWPYLIGTISEFGQSGDLELSSTNINVDTAIALNQIVITFEEV